MEKILSSLVLFGRSEPEHTESWEMLRCQGPSYKRLNSQETLLVVFGVKIHHCRLHFGNRYIRVYPFSTTADIGGWGSNGISGCENWPLRIRTPCWNKLHLNHVEIVTHKMHSSSHNLDGSEIPNNHLGCIKYLVNSGINHQTAAGFLPSLISASWIW